MIVVALRQSLPSLWGTSDSTHPLDIGWLPVSPHSLDGSSLHPEPSNVSGGIFCPSPCSPSRRFDAFKLAILDCRVDVVH